MRFPSVSMDDGYFSLRAYPSCFADQFRVSGFESTDVIHIACKSANHSSVVVFFCHSVSGFSSVYCRQEKHCKSGSVHTKLLMRFRFRRGLSATRNYILSHFCAV